MSWTDRARAGTLPTRVTGGSPRPTEPPRVRCTSPDCPESFTAPLELLAHLARCVKRAAA